MIGDNKNSTEHEGGARETERPSAIEAMARRMFELVAETATSSIGSWDAASQDYQVYWRDLARAGIVGLHEPRSETAQNLPTAIEAIARRMFEAGVAPKNVTPLIQQWETADQSLRSYWLKMARVGISGLQRDAAEHEDEIAALRYENMDLEAQIDELRGENARLLQALVNANEGMLEQAERNVELGLEIVERSIRDALCADHTAAAAAQPAECDWADKIAHELILHYYNKSHPPHGLKDDIAAAMRTVRSIASSNQ